GTQRFLAAVSHRAAREAAGAEKQKLFQSTCRHRPTAKRPLLGGRSAYPHIFGSGFTVEQMVDLCFAALATATPERMVAGGRTIEVARVRITDAGRRALAARKS